MQRLKEATKICAFLSWWIYFHTFHANNSKYGWQSFSFVKLT